jgi:formate dehydrogenase major subunit
LGLAKAPVIVFGKGVTGAQDGDARQDILKNLEDLAQAAGALLINPMGKANSHAAHAYGLDQAFIPDNPAVVYLALGDDFATPRLEKVVRKLDNPAGNHKSFLVVQASHVSSLTDIADVVLPVEMWAEQEGHYLNLEGRLQKASRILSPNPPVHSNQVVFQAIAKELNIEIDDQWREALPVAFNQDVPDLADR